MLADNWNYQEQYLGLYRGVCVNNADPKRWARIQVKCPQVYGDRVSGWAWPALPPEQYTTCVHTTTSNGADHGGAAHYHVNHTSGNVRDWVKTELPAAGGGVWLMFEGGDPSKPVWVGAFKHADNPIGGAGAVVDVPVAGNPGPPGADGTDGLSAYEVAVAGGYGGDQTAWLASLVGPQGIQGDQGDQGIQGEPGTNGTNGTNGTDGSVGATGPGVAAGGAAGNILTKVNGTDYNTQWSTAIPESAVTNLVSDLSTLTTNVGTATTNVTTLTNNDMLILMGAF